MTIYVPKRYVYFTPLVVGGAFERAATKPTPTSFFEAHSRRFGCWQTLVVVAGGQLEGQTVIRRSEAPE